MEASGRLGVSGLFFCSDWISSFCSARGYCTASFGDGAYKATGKRCAIRIAEDLSIQKASELARAGRMFELAQRFRFDLADTFAGDAELLAHFFQRVIGVHADAKAH